MKKFTISIAFIIVISALLQQFLPWWIIAFVAFVSGYTIKQNSLKSFAAGFISIFLLWLLYALMLSQANHNILATKVATLLPLQGQVWLLLLITGIIGGLVSGLASVTGTFAARLNAK